MMALAGCDPGGTTTRISVRVDGTDTVRRFPTHVSSRTELVGTKGQQWHLLTAGIFLTMAIPLALFLSIQRYFVRGMMAGSVKG